MQKRGLKVKRDGMLKKSELLCRELLDTRYHRMDPVLEKEIPMDDPLQVRVLWCLLCLFADSKTYRDCKTTRSDRNFGVDS
jgi:hypothetical protein